DLDGALNGFDIVEFSNLIDIDMMLAKYLIDRLSRRHVTFEMNKSLTLQIVDLDLGPLCEFVVRRRDQHKTITGHRYDRDAASRFGISNYAELDGAIHNVSNDARRTRIFKVDLGSGEFGHELADLCRKFMKADTINGRDLNGASDLADEATQVFFKLCISGKNISRLTIKNLTGRSETYLA